MPLGWLQGPPYRKHSSSEITSACGRPPESEKCGGSIRACGEGNRLGVCDLMAQRKAVLPLIRPGHVCINHDVQVMP